MAIELELDQVINAETGVQPLINGNQSDIWIIPMLDGSDVYDGESIEHTGPYALAKMEDVTALGLVAGNNGDTLTISGTDYTLLSIDPDSHGGAILKLTEA